MARARDPFLIAAAAAVLATAAIGTVQSLAWIGEPFPGFLVLENRVVASAGLAAWPASAGGAIYQHAVVSVDGRPLERVETLQDHVASLPVGTSVTYRLERGGRSLERSFRTRRFGAGDWTLLFGSYLFCGVGLGGMACLIRYLRGRDRVATGSALGLGIVGLYALTAADLYGPYRFFRIHVLLECLLFAGTLHMALVFPEPRAIIDRRRWLLPALYTAAFALALAAQLGLHRPDVYVLTHRVAVAVWGLALAVFIANQVHVFLRPPSFEARQRVKVLVLGTLAALLPQVVLTLGSAFSGGQASENLVGWSGIFFPLSMGYAVLRSDLLQVDALLRRSLNYLLLTGALALAYAAAVGGIESLLNEESAWSRAATGLAFGVLAVVLLLLLRDRMQSALDRVFFRSAYDFRRVIEGTSRRIASVSHLETIVDEVLEAVAATLHPDRLTLHVHTSSSGRLEPRGARDCEAVPIDPLLHLRLEIPPQEGRCVELPDEGLCVPFRSEERLVAALVLGRRRSGGYYGGDDRALLETLANHGAIAIENALALEQLRSLNRDLERKVDERTRELRDAQAQLVHREKMASLGQLVAGIAHEINNPLNFIQGNLYCLRESTEALAQLLRPDAPEADADPGSVRTLLEDIESAFQDCEEGVKRTSTLVGDLRTFSRLDRAEWMQVDLHEALDSTLNLLRTRLSGIRVVRAFGEVPRVECLAGQLNQVFMNLVANARDAMEDGGTLVLRTGRLEDGGVYVEIEDDGCGIPSEQLGRIFDPFYTSKEVGKGTGLGLSISYAVVARHGGSIRVDSEPGRGTRFRVELPRRGSDESFG